MTNVIKGKEQLRRQQTAVTRFEKKGRIAPALRHCTCTCTCACDPTVDFLCSAT